jgi:hypothetical protein
MAGRPAGLGVLPPPASYVSAPRALLIRWVRVYLDPTEREREKENVKFLLFLLFFTFGSKHRKVQKGKCYRNFANYGLIRLNRFVSSFSPHLCN